MNLDLFDYLLIIAGALAAGLVNALAGGGTLISFPMLTAVGLPAVAANVTNTVSLLPGYLGATFAQSKDMAGQRSRLLLFLPAGFIGGLLGGVLLLMTGEKLFRDLVPYLIIVATTLLAVQEPVKRWLARQREARGETKPAHPGWAVLPIGLAAVYGGYFGAGLSVILLAVLALTQEDNLTRLNAIKQFIAFSANLAAALFFLFSDQVVWPVVPVMMLGALAGGALGGRLAGRVAPWALRRLVVLVGYTVAVVYLFR